MGSHSTLFRIDDRIVSRCDDGLLLAEYAIFSPRDTEIRPSDRVRANVSGFVTSAGVARSRLEAAGVSLALADEAAAAMSQSVVDAYAQGPAVRSVASHLGAHELFEGRAYDETAQHYAGAWLDMRALASDVAVPGAGLALQALHLAAVLAEADPEARVSMATETFAPQRASPGERTFHRIQFGHVKRLVEALRGLRPASRRARDDKGDELRLDLAALLRDRVASKTTEATRRRVRALEQSLAAIDLPAQGPLANIDLWALEKQLEAHDARGVEERLNLMERTRATPGTRYLREYLAFVKGIEPPRRIAERLSQWTLAGTVFYELDLLRARVWLAAGVPRYARHYARALVEDRTAPDAVCLIALEILESTSHRARTIPPPSVRSSVPPPFPAAGSLPPPRPPMPSRPPMGSRPPMDSRPPMESRAPMDSESAPAAPEVPEPAPSVESVVESTPLGGPPPFDTEPLTERGSEAPPMTERIVEAVAIPAEVVTTAIVMTSSAPPPPSPAASTAMAIRPTSRGFMTEAPPRPPPEDQVPPSWAPPPRGLYERYVPEVVETLPLPHGSTEDQLVPGAVPRKPHEVRIACTRMARELARDYRLWYGTRLRTDALAVEAMQRHLLSRWPDGKLTGQDAAWELRRHGALLSEILARALHGYWVDVAPSEIGYWAMFVPPGTRTWPFGRIYRFVTLGHRERDLVGYYLEVHARAKRSR